MTDGRSLIVGGEIVLSGYVLMDEYAAWMTEEDAYFTPRMVREALAELGPGQVTVRLISDGGHAVAGEAIRTILAAHPGGARIVVEGMAASAASLLLMAGRPRVMSAGSILMIHDPSGVAWGNPAALRRTADAMDVMADAYAGVYAAASGRSAADIRAMMIQEVHMDAETAVAERLADEVMSGAAEDGGANAPRQIAAPARATATGGALRLSGDDAGLTPLDRVRAAQTRLAARMVRAATIPALASPAGTPAALSGATARRATSEEHDMPDNDPAAAPAATQMAQSAVAPVAPAPADAMAAERARATRIQMMAGPYLQSGRLQASEVTAMIQNGTSPEAAAAHFLTLMAGSETGASRHDTMRITQDETETRRVGMEDALVAGMLGQAPSEMGREWMGRSLTEMAATRLGQRRVPVSFGERENVIRMAMHTTGDFPFLFENALNRVLAARYAAAVPTYREIARRRSYQDFRAHGVVRLGDFPSLAPVPESGEIPAGSFSESRETTQAEAFGRQIRISRQMLVNDRLDGIRQIMDDRGAAVARYEERRFYESIFLSGANADGPTLATTTRQVFNTTDVSKAGTNAAITVASLSIARAALMNRVSLDGEKLGLLPAILLVGPNKLTEAEQVTAEITARTVADFNPFSGRLRVVATPYITGNAWYLFADPAAAPCFEWGLLDGYEAPRMRMEEPFGVQGMAVSVEHDWGGGAIDFKGGFKNAGA